MRKKIDGRKIVCSACVSTFSRGTTRVMRGIVFQFCELCWSSNRRHCEQQMLAATSPAPLAERTAA